MQTLGAIIDYHHAVSAVPTWSPKVIVLVCAESFRKTVFWAEEVNCACYAVILPEDCAIATIRFRNLIPGSCHCLHNFCPSELVGIHLRQESAFVRVLALWYFERQFLLIRQVDIDRHYWNCSRHQRDAGNHNDRCICPAYPPPLR